MAPIKAMRTVKVPPMPPLEGITYKEELEEWDYAKSGLSWEEVRDYFASIKPLKPIECDILDI